ncbi:MAG TPA: hypothetical protein VEX62_00275 [Candidatus Limnocylindrales bacterium]|nr:hypothetical protein [Candidatus Limnocylindrales bacterium]
MSKPTISRLFVGGVVAVIAGIVLAIAALAVAVSGGAFVMDGADVVGLQPTPYAWALVIVGLLAVVALIGGSVAGLVAWIGALINTAEIEDKTWFVLLLVLGLLSFGFVAMLAYLIAGPDGTRRSATAPPRAAYPAA